jgi:hypothetical protein
VIFTDDKDLFSYANSNDIVDDGESNFDLNAFSSKSLEEEANKPQKSLTKKQKVLRTILISFLVCVIIACTGVGSLLLYAFTMVDGTMEENLNDLRLNFTTTVYVDDG